MSPQAGLVLVEEIAPRLKNVVPNIKPVGCENAEELYQNGLAMAAKMLHDLEQRGKQVTSGNVCFYVTLHLKSGRRSHSSGRTDVMGSGTQLDHKSCVLSFEEPVGFDPETNEEIPLGEMLSSGADDPSMLAARNLDWEQFMDEHDHRYGAILGAVAGGGTMKPVAKRYGCSLSTISSLKGRLSCELRETFGDNIVAEATRPAAWRSSLLVEKEKAACRADRRKR